MAKKEFKKNLMHKTRRDLVDFVFRGEHHKNTFGYEGPSKRRKVGDVWEDEFYRYEQHDGYISKEGKNHEVYKEIRDYVQKLKSCQNPKCEKENYGFTDKQLILKIGLCVDCNVELELAVKAEDLWESYEKWRMYSRAIAMGEDAIKEIQSGITDLKPYYETILENGTIERWELPKPVDVMRKEMEDEIEQIKTGVEELRTDIAGFETALKGASNPLIKERLFPNG